MATQATGYQSKFRMCYEHDFAHIGMTKRISEMPFNKLDLKSEQTIINPATISGTRNAVEPARGHIKTSGSVTVPVDSVMFPRWLIGLFGNATTTDNAVKDDKGVVTTPATAYTHVFKITNNQPSFAGLKMFPDVLSAFQYSGCKLNTLKMTVGDDGELTADMDIIGSDETVLSGDYKANDSTNYYASVLADTYDAVNKVATQNVNISATTAPMRRFNNFSATLFADGVQTADVKTMDLELKMGLDDSQYTLGNKGLGAIPEGLVEVSGTIKALFNSTDTLERGINATETRLELKLTNETDSMTILLPEVQFERTSPSIDGPAGVEVEFKFSAYYNNSTEKSAIVVTVVNDRVAYTTTDAMNPTV